MKARGFSLLEVVVAVTLIGIGFSAIFAAMSGSVRGLQRVESNDHRVELARQKLAELDLIKRIRVEDSARGTFDDGTRWTLDVAPFIAPVEEAERRNANSVVRISLTLEWPGRNGMQRQVIQSYRYQTGDTASIPSLEDQLRDLQ
jgi:prepilin-type N-terminal cleavage/methylation domain-containing protein